MWVPEACMSVSRSRMRFDSGTTSGGSASTPTVTWSRRPSGMRSRSRTTTTPVMLSTVPAYTGSRR